MELRLTNPTQECKMKDLITQLEREDRRLIAKVGQYILVKWNDEYVSWRLGKTEDGKYTFNYGKYMPASMYTIEDALRAFIERVEV